MNIVLEWNKLISSKLFENIPYEIELFNKAGQLLMTPASNWHGYAQVELGHKLRRKNKNGKVIAECSILTRLGVKVADVAWASDHFIKEFGYKTPYLKAPELS